MSESSNGFPGPHNTNPFGSGGSEGQEFPRYPGPEDAYWSNRDDSVPSAPNSQPSWGEAPTTVGPAWQDSVTTTIPTATGESTGSTPGSPATKRPRKGMRAGTVALVALLAAAVGGVSGGLVDRALVSSDNPAPAIASASSSSSTGTTVTKVVQGSSSAPDWTATASAVSNSVVSITVATGSGEDEGSGVVLDSKGDIVTNNHVVSSAGSGGSLTVSIGDRTYDATVVGTDPSTDLAVIRVTNPPSTLTPITFADSSKLSVGAPVMAVGNPLGLSGSVTTGIISALNRPVTTTSSSTQQSPLGSRDSSSGVVVTSAIQTSAAINPGNSGGALVNANGKLIGINSSIASLSSGSSGQSGNIGIGFAIPSNLVKSISDQIIASGKATHAYLGITVRDASASQDGAKVLGAGVASVASGSAASSAGLQAGDVIAKVNDTEVTSGESLVALVRSFKAGQKVSVTYIRNSDESTADVTLGTAKS